MAEIGIPHATASSSNSPPPNCAICLGTCTNKCFSDSCMHQFCFTCLLEWSKVKAECPLCKQPFTSIIHNVKSNNEYDEHIVEPGGPGRQDILDENEFLYLPTTAQPSRHFQFRTTFTVDPRGELAIQQMLLTHRLTNSVYMPNYNYNYRHFRHRHRRDLSSTNFRRFVYTRNMWVTSPPDVTGRYRDISPHFYRDNPAAINRLVPWLNRELNALLEENTQQVMLLVDIILGHLNRHYIRGFFFKNLLREYLGSRTEHFIHEFYNFMKSPYDMVGYDRHVYYAPRNSFIHTIPSDDSTSSSDSDITVVATTSAPNPNLFHRPTIEVIEINSDSSRDSDVVIHEPPPPVVVDLINTTDEEVTTGQQQTSQVETKRESSSGESDVKPKQHSSTSKKDRKYREKYEKVRRKHKSKSRHIYSSTDSDSDSSSSSSSTSSSSSSSSDSANYKYYKRRRKQKVKKSSKSKYVSTSDNSTDDDKPLLEKLKKMKESSSRKPKRKEKIRKYYRSYKGKHSTSDNETYNGPIKSNSYYPEVKTDVPSSSDVSNSFQDEQNHDSDKPLDYSMAGFAGPSYHNSNAPRVKKERYNLWYSRPRVYESDDSTSSSN